MTQKKLIDLLNSYKCEIENILSRFNKGTIANGDKSKLQIIVSELSDLFYDEMGENHYSSSIVSNFNKGVSHSYVSVIYNSVEAIHAIVSSSITRIERNPEILNKKEIKDTKEKTLEYPEKMTLNWLWVHVSVSYMWGFILLLFFVFSLGIGFGNTKLYKSLSESETAKIKETMNIKTNSEKKKNSTFPIIFTPKS
jgi:hypothetical protein